MLIFVCIITSTLIVLLFRWRSHRVSISATLCPLPASSSSSSPRHNKKQQRSRNNSPKLQGNLINAEVKHNNTNFSLSENEVTTSPSKKSETAKTNKEKPIQPGSLRSVINFLLGKDPTATSTTTISEEGKQQPEKENENERTKQEFLAEETTWDLQHKFPLSQDMRKVGYLNHLLVNFFSCESFLKKIEEKVEVAIKQRICELEQTHESLLRDAKISFRLREEQQQEQQEFGDDKEDSKKNDLKGENAPTNEKKEEEEEEEEEGEEKIVEEEQKENITEEFLKNLPLRFKGIQVLTASLKKEGEEEKEVKDNNKEEELRISVEFSLGKVDSPSVREKKNNDDHNNNTTNNHENEQNKKQKNSETEKRNPIQVDVGVDFSARVGLLFGRFIPIQVSLSNFWISTVKVHFIVQVNEVENKNLETDNDNKEQKLKQKQKEENTNNNNKETQDLLTIDSNSNSNSGLSSNNNRNNKQNTNTNNFEQTSSSLPSASTSSSPFLPQSTTPLRLRISAFIEAVGDIEFDLHTCIGEINNNKKNSSSSSSWFSLQDFAPIALWTERSMKKWIEHLILPQVDNSNSEHENATKKANVGEKKPVFQFEVSLN